MHGSKVIMQRKCLNQRIVLLKATPHSRDELAKRLLASLAPQRPSMSRHSESHIVISRTQCPRFAMIIITASHNQPMQFTNQLCINLPVTRKARNPAVGPQRSVRLSLGTRKQFLGSDIRL